MSDQWKGDILALAKRMIIPQDDPDVSWQPEAIITIANEWLSALQDI